MRFYSFSLRKKRKYAAYLELCTALQLLEVQNVLDKWTEALDLGMMLTCYVHVVAYVVLYQMLSDNPCKHNQ
jgi:hypothetical protein